jgi:hypothetical protein
MRDSTSMPSSGAASRGSTTTRRRSTRGPPSSARSTRASVPVTMPPAVDERTCPSAARPSRSASACGIAELVAPVSTRKSMRSPLSVPGQWKWPSSARCSSMVPAEASKEKRARAACDCSACTARKTAVPISNHSVTSFSERGISGADGRCGAADRPLGRLRAKRAWRHHAATMP